MDFGIQAPEKNVYKFNELASLTGVKPYVLRFWETEFQQISPVENENGQKSYDKSDLLVIKTIKKLLFEDKLSIPDAKSVIDKELEAIANNQTQEVESPEEVAINLKEQTRDLKEALEEVIEKGAESVKVESEESEFVCKAGPLASRFKKEVRVHQRSLSDQDVVSLVSAKKKLNKLLGQINDLESKYSWN
ncbi:MAG: MerR family transcriptional regulator [Bacteriovoracaceae bacterium]|nr:MerR family transcriptional regulator [Bacteriovoracaceae bacterium]